MTIPPAVTAAIGKWLVQLLIQVGEAVVRWIAQHEFVGSTGGAIEFIKAIEPTHTVIVIDADREVSWIKANKPDEEL